MIDNIAIMARPNLIRREATVDIPDVDEATGVKPSDPDTRSYLPDFGSPALFIQFLFVAGIITVVVAVSRYAVFSDSALTDSVLIALFALTVAIASFVALKLLAHPISGMGLVAGAVTAFLVILIVSALTTELFIWLLHLTGHTPERWPADHLGILVRTLLITAVVAMFVLRYSMINARVEVESESQQDDRLQALQSRIRPHFMFNSLNSVASLIRSEPEIAEKALEDLADVFRVMLQDARKMVPITVEGELARQYLEIEKIRLGERLSVRWIASNVPRSALIPSLTIQPLVENAVYHGIEPSSNGGMIKVNLWSEGETLKIAITNPLPERQQKNHRPGNNMALDNVRERLERHFGGRAVLENGEKDGYYDVRIQIPVVRG